VGSDLGSQVPPVVQEMSAELLEPVENGFHDRCWCLIKSFRFNVPIWNDTCNSLPCRTIYSGFRLRVVRGQEMRRSLPILALLGLSVTYGAGTVRADGVDYTVSGKYAAITNTPSTPLSNPGDTFTFSFFVDSAMLTSQVNGMSNAINIKFDYSDSSGDILTNQPGVITFFSTSFGQLGLFNIEFFPPGGGDFFLQLQGPDSGFNVGPPLSLNTGMFTPTPGDTTTGLGSNLGDFDPSNPNFPMGFGQDAILMGSVDAVATPEPSSLLLLGSGFIALGSFARKRISASHN
jgi:PEP-CTERM motif